jgi:hypothetical protein
MNEEQTLGRREYKDDCREIGGLQALALLDGETIILGLLRLHYMLQFCACDTQQTGCVTRLDWSKTMRIVLELDLPFLIYQVSDPRHTRDAAVHCVNDTVSAYRSGT